jgi:hypothetical protein
MVGKKTVGALSEHAPRFSPHERANIRAKEGVSIETITRYERGDRITDASKMRIERACTQLGIRLSANLERTR